MKISKDKISFFLWSFLCYFSSIPIIYYFLILPLSYLPLWILYGISDLFYFLLYYVVSYRKKVVFEGVRNSFPHKTPEEIEEIARRFFVHFCDVVMESIKGCTISANEVRRRYRYTNIEILEKYKAQGRRVTILGPHFSNWEWNALGFPLAAPDQHYAVYQTLTNPFMDRIIKTTRERTGMKLISTKEVAHIWATTPNDRGTVGYVADQSPGRTGRKFWMKFLNQDTAASGGYEKFAKEYNSPVIYVSIEQKKRGYFEGTLILLTDEPRTMKEGEIVAAFYSVLERKIKERPELWLWTHRRWKLKRENRESKNS